MTNPERDDALIAEKKRLADILEALMRHRKHRHEARGFAGCIGNSEQEKKHELCTAHSLER